MRRYQVHIELCLYLNREIQVNAENMDEAITLVKAMARNGEIDAPESSDLIGDWMVTEDGKFIIDGEVI